VLPGRVSETRLAARGHHGNGSVKAQYRCKFQRTMAARRQRPRLQKPDRLYCPELLTTNIGDSTRSWTGSTWIGGVRSKDSEES
jgi:hypothetical protein